MSYMRDVFIHHDPNKRMIFVVYANRVKGGRHYFAQFDDRYSVLDDVIAFVRTKNNVRLVCALSGNPI